MDNKPSLHGIIEHHIKQCYRDLNGITCPWDGSEGLALKKMLKANPSWGEMKWLAMVSNHFLSDRVNGALPREWLPRISKYARGPLDGFGKVKGEKRDGRPNAVEAIRNSFKSPL